MKTYKGLIRTLAVNQVFVFGSNTQGRHGKGAALWAINNAGATYGIPMGRQGNSYAIITKDLTQPIHPSIPRVMIVTQIAYLYLYAVINSKYEFLIAYTDTSIPLLNGYHVEEMADMFIAAVKTVFVNKSTIPDNIVFEEGFARIINSKLIAG